MVDFGFVVLVCLCGLVVNVAFCCFDCDGVCGYNALLLCLASLIFTDWF